MNYKEAKNSVGRAVIFFLTEEACWVPGVGEWTPNCDEVMEAAIKYAESAIVETGYLGGGFTAKDSVCHAAGAVYAQTHINPMYNPVF